MTGVFCLWCKLKLLWGCRDRSQGLYKDTIKLKKKQQRFFTDALTAALSVYLRYISYHGSVFFKYIFPELS